MMELLVFGDQTADCHLFLKRAFLRKNLVLLRSFLERVNSALREEVTRLPSLRRGQLPSFSTIEELVERHYVEKLTSPATESAITCIAQFVHLIGSIEEGQISYPTPSNTRILGLCTGSLTAAAIACSETLPDLIPLAVEVVRIAFRTGIHVRSIAEQLEQECNTQSWSVVVAGLSHDSVVAALEKFHNDKTISKTGRVYVSAVSTSAITISGPPSMLKRLFESSEAFRNVHTVQVPIHGPYHAPHLHTAADVQSILSQSRKNIGTRPSLIPLYSTLDGKHVPSTTTGDLLEDCLTKILIEPIRWDKVLSECTSEIQATPSPSCRIYAFGPANLTGSLVSALKLAGNIQVSLEDHRSWMSQGPVSSLAPSRMSDSKIAIVGMAGRFPNAADHELFWELLEKGLDVHREVPKDRFDVEAHYDPAGKRKNTSHTPFGCFIDNPGLFDNRFFNMSPREAAQTDPMHRLALTTAYEAMEMSGIVPNRTPSTMNHRIGTFYGQTSDDWREINAAQDIDTYFITGGVRAFAPGRINYFFKFSGPSFSIDTACSSSLAAIQIACTSLRAGECDTALTGGMNVLTNPDIFSGLSRGQFLSKTGSCKTYDHEADGYCRGDGVASVVLKRYEDAIADKDPILGVILGSATNHSAEAVSITHPHAGAQQFLFQKVMDEAGVDPHDVSYVEMHGTGTQAGDGVEMKSVTSVFAPPHRRRRPDQSLHLGAVKSNIGHGEAVSGVCSLIKIMLMLQKNAIPPHCGVKGVMNKGFPKDMNERNIRIAFEKAAFPRPAGGKRRVFLNNFSAAGGNTALLLEDGPEKAPLVSRDPRTTHILTVSAKTLASFRKNVQNFLNYIKSHGNVDLPSLAYTTTARRVQHNYRVALAVSDVSQALEILQPLTTAAHTPVPSTAPKVAFAFTGQGSQYPALGKSLFETSQQFKTDILNFDRIAQGQGFPSFVCIVDGSAKDTASQPPVVVQLAMTCIQIALARLWASWGITPTSVIGHSLGEYAALHVAGVLSIESTIFLVGQRAQLLQTDCTVGTHVMLAVKASKSSIEAALTGRTLEIACINAPQETVLSGTVDEINSIAEDLATKGLKCTKLNVPFAFHSSQVDPILKSFETAAGSVIFHAPRIPVISPLLSKAIEQGGIIGPAYLSRHAREAVDFKGALESASLDKLIDTKTVWVEVGPHPVCSGMIKNTLGMDIVTAPSLRRGEDPLKTIPASLCVLYSGGIAIDWSEYHREYDDAHDLLQLPTYSFDEKVFWLQYTGNWCLTKGDNVLALPAPKVPSLSTTSVQKVIKEEFKDNKATVVIESDLADPLLHAAVSGHLVNGAGLCPSSIYADMALTVADYAHKRLRPDGKAADMNCRNMEVFKPFIAKDITKPTHQIIQVSVEADLTLGRAEVRFNSLAADGKTKVDHAKCIVDYEDAEKWLTDWERSSFLIQTRIDMLKQKMNDGRAHRILRGMAYKLFAALVQYDDKYRGMEEVILDSDQLEATSKVSFQADEKNGNFLISPYFIDSLAHISGFIMNGNDAVDSKTQVYISHGWESMRFAKKIEADKHYRSYVKMQSAGGKMVAGDVYIFDEEDKIVAVVGGVKFQCIPRTLLNTFLPPAGAAKAPVRAAPVAKAQATKVSEVSKTVVKKGPVVAVSTTKRVQQSSGLTAQALKVVAQEIGVDVSELADSVDFSNMGVDSLMSLTISGKFREEFDLDVSSSSFFIDHPTVADLKKYLAQHETGSADVPSDASASSPEESSDSASDSGISTPELSTAATSRRGSEDLATPDLDDSNDTLAVIRSTIAKEMGVDIEEIAPTTDLSSMGMDSLMSLTILGALRETTGLELGSNFLMENGSIADIEVTLGLKPKALPKPNTHALLVEQKLDSLVVRHRPATHPPATSHILQGNQKTATRKMFLFPDGSGSATSYVHIPALDKDLVVYGLNCPYMKDPKSYTCGIPGVTEIYLQEVRRRQPKGPYIFGGWSAGGVVAYEATRQLLEQGEEVSHLILIDAPCPIRLEPLPSRLHRFFDKIGLLGTGSPKGTPEWLLPHFESSIKALTAYQPKPIPASQKISKISAIWCRDGVCGKPTDPRPPPQSDDPKSMKWLLDNRTDFSYNGWDKLLGESIICTDMPGNHFSMMKDPIAQELGDHIRAGLA